MLGLGAPELLIILGIVVLIFGGSKLPKLARSIGEAKNEFEKSSHESPTPAAKDEPKPVTAAADQVTMTRGELDALLAKRDTAPAEEQVTMSRAELDRLLAERRAHNDG